MVILRCVVSLFDSLFQGCVSINNYFHKITIVLDQMGCVLKVGSQLTLPFMLTRALQFDDVITFLRPITAGLHFERQRSYQKTLRLRVVAE